MPKINPVEYLPLVRAVYRQVRAKVSRLSGLDLQNVYLAGVAELVRCAPRWRDDGGATFGVYAWKCVRGRMLSTLRLEYNWWALNKPTSEGRKPKRLVLFGDVGDSFTCARDPAFARADESIANLERSEAIRFLTDGVLELLDKRRRRVVAMRCGFGFEPMTLDQVAQVLGVTRSRVQQLEAYAFIRIRYHFRQSRWRELLTDVLREIGSEYR